MRLHGGLLGYAEGWDFPHVYLFTGNPVVTELGRVVMGRGAAKEVRDSYPNIDMILGATLEHNRNANLLWVSLGPTQTLGWFKVKHHWKSQADLTLIQESTSELIVIAKQRPEIMFHMNFPGIGNGRLAFNDVHEIVKHLPDNVCLYGDVGDHV